MTLMIDKDVAKKYSYKCDEKGFIMSRRVEEFMKKDLERMQKIKQII
jgi:hypothetical protein